MTSELAESPTAAHIRGEPVRSLQPRLVHVLMAEFAMLFWFLGAALLVYSTTLATQYAYLDDYTGVANAERRKFAFAESAAMGRPLAGVIASRLPQLFHIFSLHSLPYIRFISIVGLSILAWTIYRSLSWARWPKTPAALLSFTLCTLPASQVFAAWSSCWTYPYGGILGAIAAWVAWDTLSQFEAGKPRFSPSPQIRPPTAYARVPSNPGPALEHQASPSPVLDYQRIAVSPPWSARPSVRVWIGAASAALLLVASISIYQPTAMVYWVVVAIDILRPSFDLSRRTLRRLIGYGLIGCAGLAGGWIVFLVGTRVYPWAVQPNRRGVTLNPRHKLGWFFRQPLPAALNLHNIFPSTAVAWGLVAFIVIGLVFFLRGPLIARLAGIGLALAFIPLAYIPNLIASENWASSRTQFAMGSLILILAFFALNGYWSLLRRPVPTALLFMLAIAGAISATLTVTRYIVAPQAIELAYVRFAVVGPGEAHSRNVYLIPPQMTDTPAPANGLDEFGRPSTWAKWTQHEIVADVRQDAFGSAVKTNVTVITPADATNLTLGPDTVLLDMRNLRDAR